MCKRNGGNVEQFYTCRDFHMSSSNFPPQKISYRLKLFSTSKKIIWTQIIPRLKKIEWPQLISHLNELIGESSWWSVPSIRRNSALKMIDLNLNTMKGDGGRELNWARQGFLCFSRLHWALIRYTGSSRDSCHLQTKRTLSGAGFHKTKPIA